MDSSALFFLWLGTGTRDRVPSALSRVPKLLTAVFPSALVRHPSVRVGSRSTSRLPQQRLSRGTGPPGSPREHTADSYCSELARLHCARERCITVSRRNRKISAVSMRSGHYWDTIAGQKGPLRGERTKIAETHWSRVARCRRSTSLFRTCSGPYIRVEHRPRELLKLLLRLDPGLWHFRRR